MDVLEYINSQDISDYLRAIDFKFNAIQAAYVIYINDWLTISDRIRLWREVIETMPDCEFQYLQNDRLYTQPSAHEAISDHIARAESDLEGFLASTQDEGSALYIPVASRWNKRPEWIEPSSIEYEHIGCRVWNPCEHPAPFSSFEKCKDYLRKETGVYERSESWGKCESFDRHLVGKTFIDDSNADCYAKYPAPEPINFFLEQITLNADLEPIGIRMDLRGNLFDRVVPNIPHPYEQGDILIDSTSCTALPFVFDRCVTWKLEDEEDARRRCKDHYDFLERKGVPFERRKTWRMVDTHECDDAIADRSGTYGSLYFAHGHMFAYGYEVDVADIHSVIKYSWAGACDNYLNLEYYKGAFEDGKLAILPTVSWFITDEDTSTLNEKSWLSRYSDKVKKWNRRGLPLPDHAPYDICSLVNEGFKLR